MYLESVHLLNPCNELDLFALHYVYTERINNHIAEWMDAWNRHPIISCAALDNGYDQTYWVRLNHCSRAGSRQL